MRPRPSTSLTPEAQQVTALGGAGLPGRMTDTDHPRRQRIRAAKRRLFRAGERHVVNPINRSLIRRGRLGSTYALLETTGRRTGLPRQTPVANGLEGDTFWLISAHGSHAHYVHNLLADPRVRVGLADAGAVRWRSGTAHLLGGDDTRSRQRALAKGRLGYRIDAVILRAVATELSTVRIDLHPDQPAGIGRR
jgi:deazaflavin-dependent oxidoreductase (nitroreductase family)